MKPNGTYAVMYTMYEEMGVSEQKKQQQNQDLSAIKADPSAKPI